MKASNEIKFLFPSNFSLFSSSLSSPPPPPPPSAAVFLLLHAIYRSKIQSNNMLATRSSGNQGGDDHDKSIRARSDLVPLIENAKSSRGFLTEDIASLKGVVVQHTEEMGELKMLLKKLDEGGAKDKDELKNLILDLQPRARGEEVILLICS